MTCQPNKLTSTALPYLLSRPCSLRTPKKVFSQSNFNDNVTIYMQVYPSSLLKVPIVKGITLQILASWNTAEDNDKIVRLERCINYASRGILISMIDFACRSTEVVFSLQMRNYRVFCSHVCSCFYACISVPWSFLSFYFAIHVRILLTFRDFMKQCSSRS